MFSKRRVKLDFSGQFIFDFETVLIIENLHGDSNVNLTGLIQNTRWLVKEEYLVIILG